MNWFSNAPTRPYRLGLALDLGNERCGLGDDSTYIGFGIVGFDILMLGQTNSDVFRFGPGWFSIVSKGLNYIGHKGLYWLVMAYDGFSI